MNELNELIEKLKDKTYVRAFGLMTAKEQECYHEAKPINCIFYSTIGCWADAIDFAKGQTFAIKPDYQPEPEYVDLEVTYDGGFLCVYREDTVITKENFPYTFVHLHCLPSLPNFEKFVASGQIILTEHVAVRIRDNEKVYAKFRKG